jgi:hypothetical protein
MHIRETPRLELSDDAANRRVALVPNSPKQESYRTDEFILAPPFFTYFIDVSTQREPKHL